uniref:Aminotransferase-like plant mobile domain-containing protein n=1 Tax=Oryza punctata TaxID=4537 RepID=A0A0E0L0H5_ORYPU
MHDIVQKKISDGNSCSTLPVLIPRTAGWWGIDPRWKPRPIYFGCSRSDVAVAQQDDYTDAVDDRPTFGTRWCYGPPQWARIQVHNVYEYFTESFESLTENKVRWTPYTNEEANLRAPNGVSILCYRDEAYWMTRKMLVYDIFVEGYNVQRVMRQMGLYQQVPVPTGLHLPPDMHTQKRQADNRYRQSMHLRMTTWIEAWSQALNDVVHEIRAYDHNTYEQYMALTRIWLLAPQDPDERGPPNIEQIYDMQHAPPAHLTTDIAGGLVREAKTLWEKLRDGIAGTNQEVMAAVDSLHRKGKRIMRLASCRHSSDVYTTATSRRTFEQMPERPSTSSRPSISTRPSASARRFTDGRAIVRSTSVREAPTIPTIPEITQMSERLGGFGPTQEGTRMVRPVPQMPHARPHMISQMMPDVPTLHWQGGFAPFAGTSQGIPTIPRVDAEFIGQGGFTSLGGPTQSVPLHAPTYGTNPWQGQSIDYGGTLFGAGVLQGYMDLLQQGDWLFGQYPSHRNEIPYMQAPSTGSFRPELMAGFRPYTSSYGDMSSFGGGSSSVPNELRASQTDDAPQMTQPTQPDDGDLQGNIHDPRRSNRECHEPNRLSLSGPRHAAGRRKKTTSTLFGAGVLQGYMDLLQQGDWLFGQYPSHRNEIPYMQAPSTGFRPYTSSYGDMSSFGGGSSSVPNELRASQTDDAPQMTQPTQPDDGDLQGNIHDPRRSNRECHEPNRLSLSGPRHAAGRRKKTTSKRANTSRTMTDHDDE